MAAKVAAEAGATRKSGLRIQSGFRPPVPAFSTIMFETVKIPIATNQMVIP
jgi:hypothetical protein